MPILSFVRLLACRSFSFSLSSRSRSLSVSNDGLCSTIELASEAQDRCFKGFHIQNDGFFAPLTLQLCPHGSSLLVFHSGILEQCPFFYYLSGVIAGLHRFPSVFVAIVVEIRFRACDFVISPSGSPPMRLLCDLVPSWVRCHLLFAVVVVGDSRFSRSSGELWVPA